jgi:acetyl esterase/lipase
VADDPFITPELMGFFNAMYVPGGDVRSPSVTPFYRADLQGLPPVRLQVGSRELLRDDARTFAARLKAAGVDAECTVWEAWSTAGNCLPRRWTKRWCRWSWRGALLPSTSAACRTARRHSHS